MKCLQCGFPLSPTRTHCPRCGASNGNVKGAATPRLSPAPGVPSPSQPTEQDNRFDGSYVDLSTPPAAWNTPTSAASWDAVPHTAPPQTAPSAFAPADNGYYGQPGQVGYFGNVMEQGQGYPSPEHASEPLSYAPLLPPLQPPQPVKRQRSSRFGFTLAGLCLITGALLLVFVYFMSISLGAPATSNQTAASSTGTKAAVAPTAQPSPTPMISPTPSFPGQQYISNAQMASAINTNTAQSVTPTTTFQVKARMYVTFQVHTSGAAGGVCLLWYLNNSLFTTFNFPVPSDTSAYSYALPGTTGTGNVEIYWAPHNSCADPDKVLGQRLDFTVTP